MNTPWNENQHTRHGDGKFATMRRGEQGDVDLTLTPALAGVPAAAAAPTTTRPAAAGGEAAARLTAAVRHPDWRQRVAVLSDPQLTAAHLKELADPTQPAAVRLAVAALPNPGVAARAALDPHPIVRLQAAHSGWDLSEADRHRLGADPAVAHARQLLRLSST